MRLPPLVVNDSDRIELERRTRSGTIASRDAQRARIVLLAAGGVSNRDISEIVGLHYNQVGLWRSRYERLGIAGLDDEPRVGRPPVYSHDDILLLVKTSPKSRPTVRLGGRWRHSPEP